MNWQIILSWSWFCIALGLSGIIAIIMSLQAKNLYTYEGIAHRFSIMDLEIVSTPQEIPNIIQGIYQLPEDEKNKSLKALKGQLLIDFLFMPVTYGAIFIICMQVSAKMVKWWGRDIFIALAWAQCLCWFFDIIENIYLLNKIKPTVMPSSAGLHAAYQNMELAKWGLSLTGAVCAITALFYFWVSGNYSQLSLPYVSIATLEIILFLVGRKLLVK